MKKNIKILLIIIIVSIGNTAVIADGYIHHFSEPPSEGGGGGGVSCHCTLSTGECKANGASDAQCAPGGSAKCWKYDKNC